MNSESIVLGMGCFWGAQKRMGAVSGVISTEVGYAGGTAPHPTYKSVLAAEHSNAGTNHAEVVRVTFDPTKVSLENILSAFWQNHDPTQGNRQGNDIGSNYRSTIYYTNDRQLATAQATRAVYQDALHKAGYGDITTEIKQLDAFYLAEDYHQNYLVKNPRGYCGLGGTGVAFPNAAATPAVSITATPLNGNTLDQNLQLVMYEADGCPYCKLFVNDILNAWQASVAIIRTASTKPPTGWTLAKPVNVTPTLVLFKQGKEIERYTGYQGDKQRFWTWLGQQLLTPEQRRIAYTAGTEPPFTGSLLDQQTTGTYVDPVSGQPLFRSDTKFHSGTGWPSFFDPIPGALVLHPDDTLGMRRVEVRSASSGIHLGHVFDDGPPPTGKRYCINSAVLRFIPDRPDTGKR